jgi:ATP-binding cassette, subfamily F, member 3
MLTAHHIQKFYNLDVILDDVSLNIVAGDRVGLIGPNGCGKTTLIRILAGIDPPDAGHVSLIPSNLRLGYLPQNLEIDPKVKIGQLIRDLFQDSQVMNDLNGYSPLISPASPISREIQPDPDGSWTGFQDPERPLRNFLFGETAEVFRLLGLDGLKADQPVGSLSGGQKTRLSLTLAVWRHPQLLLLDEPTNHLDIPMLEWIEKWISSFPGAALIVSHDRTFLDRTVKRILYLDPEIHSLRQYTGNYSDYFEQSLAEKSRYRSAYQDQVETIRRMQRDIHRVKQQSVRVEQSTTPRQPGVRRIAKKVARKALAREKKLQRYLESDDRLEKPVAGWNMKLEFGSSPGKNAPSNRLGKDVLSFRNLSVGYPGIPALLHDLNLQIQANRRIAFTGPNGCGKTTLMRTIAGQLLPLSGELHLGVSVRLGYMPQEQELLNPELNAVATLQAYCPLNETEARSFLHYYLFTGDDALRTVHLFSNGERARLMLAILVAQGCNLLLLDEPINHLDIPSRVRFEQSLAHFEGTTIAVVHDRYFIQRFATDCWMVEGGRIRHEIFLP